MQRMNLACLHSSVIVTSLRQLAEKDGWKPVNAMWGNTPFSLSFLHNGKSYAELIMNHDLGKKVSNVVDYVTLTYHLEQWNWLWISSLCRPGRSLCVHSKLNVIDWTPRYSNTTTLWVSSEHTLLELTSQWSRGKPPTYSEDLVQDWDNSSALAMELSQSCIKLWVWSVVLLKTIQYRTEIMLKLSKAKPILCYQRYLCPLNC